MHKDKVFCFAALITVTSLMLSACGKQEPPKTEAPAPTTQAAPAAEAPAPATASTASAGDEGPGAKTYKNVCSLCHSAGIGGAPKFADKAAWEPRIKQGADVLHDHALKGFTGSAGTMPPKGGRPDLPDDDIKAAVDYMVSAAK
jgi:cytochrome c5